jgi:tetratricopeptide (TPR) repeat protein
MRMATELPKRSTDPMRYRCAREVADTVSGSPCSRSTGAGSALRRVLVPLGLALLALALLESGCGHPPPGEVPPPTETPAPELQPPAPAPSPEVAFQRGTAALEAGRYSDAIPDLYAVIHAEPGNLVARYNLGVALTRVRQWKEAVEVLTAAGTEGIARQTLAERVSLPADVDADYLHALGTVYRELRDFDSALACFDAAVVVDPRHLKSRYSRALTLETRGDLTQARAAWRDYIKRDPKSSWGESARKHLADVQSRLTGARSP